MREVLGQVERWAQRGDDVALARVVALEGSGPRLPGAAMAVSARGEVVGSVSGGCVEGAVVTEALEVLGSGVPRMSSFGFSDEDAFSVGLTCGGTVRLFIEAVPAAELTGPGVWRALAESLGADRPVALATVVSGPHSGAKALVDAEATLAATITDPDLARVVERDAGGELAAGRSGIRHYGEHGEAGEQACTVFVETFASPPSMFVFGAVDFTSALVRVAKVLGYRVTVCDAREVFATTQRFPQADRVVVDWPDRLLAAEGPSLGPTDAICVLTHDAKFDVPALLEAFRTDAGYIGAMGSRATHADRLRRLRERGATPEDLERLHAPIGLDLGGRTPEETAISICAEIIAARTGRDARRLVEGSGPLH